MDEDTFGGRREALAAAAKHTPYGEVILAIRAELEGTRAELAEIKAAIEKLGEQ